MFMQDGRELIVYGDAPPPVRGVVVSARDGGYYDHANNRIVAPGDDTITIQDGRSVYG